MWRRRRNLEDGVNVERIWLDTSCTYGNWEWLGNNYKWEDGIFSKRNPRPSITPLPSPTSFAFSTPTRAVENSGEGTGFVPARFCCQCLPPSGASLDIDSSENSNQCLYKRLAARTNTACSDHNRFKFNVVSFQFAGTDIPRHIGARGEGEGGYIEILPT